MDRFTLVTGQLFTVVEYGSRVGQFATIESSTLDPGLTLVPSYESTRLVLSVVQP